MKASSAARAARKRRQGLPGPRSRRRKGNLTIVVTRSEKASISFAARSMRASSLIPKTARRITARVIRWVWVRSAKGSPTGQVSMSRRVAASISSP